MGECHCQEISDIEKKIKRIKDAKKSFLDGPTPGRFETLKTDINILHDGCSDAFDSVNEVSLKGYINGLDNYLEVVKNSVISKIDSCVTELNEKHGELKKDDEAFHLAEKEKEEKEKEKEKEETGA